MSLGRVLVVDDDKNICELLRLYLEKEGYGVILAHDGEEAVVKFNALKPDIILLDIMLPGIDGWQVCREIRQYSKVPIIMLTARSDERDELLGFELGVDEYISKPFSPKILVARVTAILRRTNALASDDLLHADGIEIDKAAHMVKIDGKPIELSYKDSGCKSRGNSSKNQHTGSRRNLKSRRDRGKQSSTSGSGRRKECGVELQRI